MQDLLPCADNLGVHSLYFVYDNEIVRPYSIDFSPGSSLCCFQRSLFTNANFLKSWLSYNNAAETLAALEHSIPCIAVNYVDNIPDTNSTVLESQTGEEYDVLPILPETLCSIFTYLGVKDLSTTVRLVCRQWKIISEDSSLYLNLYNQFHIPVTGSVSLLTFRSLVTRTIHVHVKKSNGDIWSCSLWVKPTTLKDTVCRAAGIGKCFSKLLAECKDEVNDLETLDKALRGFMLPHNYRLWLYEDLDLKRIAVSKYNLSKENPFTRYLRSPGANVEVVQDYQVAT